MLGLRLGGKERLIYKTRIGIKYDLTEWSQSHVDFLRRAYLHYLNDMKYIDFAALIFERDSPLHGITNPTKVPLFRVLTDLKYRLGVKQNYYTKDWEGDIDPEWPLTE